MPAKWGRRMSFRKVAGFVLLCLILGALLAPANAFAQDEPDEGSNPGFLSRIDTFIGDWVVAPMAKVLFLPIKVMPQPENPEHQNSIPLVVTALVFGGVFFTFRYGFVNVRLFRHSFSVIRGRFDRPGDTGEVTHSMNRATASAWAGVGSTYFFLWAQGASMTVDQAMPGLRYSG